MTLTREIVRLALTSRRTAIVGVLNRRGGSRSPAIAALLALRSVIHELNVASAAVFVNAMLTTQPQQSVIVI
jgi:hypothetical protein